MTSNLPTNLPENLTEPADLSQLAATDALLDRLGDRNTADDDRDDPSVAALLELVAFVDESREPDLGLGRLVEVLAGRPLYMTAPDEAAESSEVDVDRPAHTAPAGGRASSESRVIDLTSHDVPDRDLPDHDLPDLANLEDSDRDREDDLVVAGRTVRSIGSGSGAKKKAVEAESAESAESEQAGGRRWERVLNHASMLPAASVLFLLVLGSGVSAAVTGNPMTPVNGVSRVMAQLPGVDDSQSNLDRVQSEIAAATVAAAQHNGPAASRHLAEAKRGLDDVPDGTKPALLIQIAQVESQLVGDPTVSPIVRATGAPGDGTDPVTGPGSGPTGTPVIVAPSSAPPEGTNAPTSAPVDPTAAPTTTAAVPSGVPTTPDTKVTAAATGDPEPQPTASGS
jgi:hypothetical protein